MELHKIKSKVPDIWKFAAVWAHEHHRDQEKDSLLYLVSRPNPKHVDQSLWDMQLPPTDVLHPSNLMVLPRTSIVLWKFKLASEVNGRPFLGLINEWNFRFCVIR